MGKYTFFKDSAILNRKLILQSVRQHLIILRKNSASAS